MKTKVRKMILFYLLFFLLFKICICQSYADDVIIPVSSITKSVAFSPDGKTLASGHGDNTVILWDAKTGSKLKTLKGHSRAVFSVAFSSDGKILASGSADSRIILWNVTTGNKIKTLVADSESVSTIYSLDGRIIGKEYNTVHSINFSPNGDIIASGNWDETVMLWNVQTGDLVKTLSGHTDAVYSVKFNSDGRILASGSADNVIKLWDVRTGNLIRTLKGHSQPIGTIAFSPDGRTIASGSGDNTIILWDVATGKEIKTLIGHSSFLSSVAFSPDGKILASGSTDNTIILWNVATGDKINTLKGYPKSDSVKIFIRVGGNIVASGYNIELFVDFSPNGKILASGNDNTIMLWDLCRHIPCIGR